MSDHDEEYVREIFLQDCMSGGYEIEAARFDRWLNTVKAEAWERGLIQGRAASIDGVDLDLIDNPYRKEADQ